MNLRKWLPHGILILAVLVAYANCLQNEFVWDDEFLIEKNTYLRSFAHLPKMLVSNSTAGFGGVDNFYRPTQNVYYLFIFQMFGYNKMAFHLGNILLHAVNALLLFSFVSTFFANRRWAFATSLLWALHPTHVEAIGYISGTADPMGLLFFLLGLQIMPWRDFTEHKKAWALAVVCFVLSLVSKEAMIVVPPLLVLLLAYKNPGERWNWRTYLSTLPFWCVAGGYLWLRKTALNFNETFDFYKATNIYTENMHYRLYTFLATLPEYLKILFFPVDLHMERKFPVHANLLNTPVVVGLVIVGIGLIFTLWQFFKNKTEWSLLGFLWFFISFVPMMGILVPVNSFILEHWLYLPSIGFFLAFTGMFFANPRADQSASAFVFTPVQIIGLGVLALALMATTLVRNRDWRDPITFYSNILKYSEGSARVHNNIAMAYGDKNQTQKAIEHYLKAIAIADAYPQTHYNLARAYIQQQDYQKAFQHLQRSLEINPKFKYSSDLLQSLKEFEQSRRR